jgi:hypothetical protein
MGESKMIHVDAASLGCPKKEALYSAKFGKKSFFSAISAVKSFFEWRSSFAGNPQIEAALLHV